MPDNPPKPSRDPRPTPPAGTAPVPAPSGRVISLDALRGFDMFWIIGGDQLVLAAIALIPKPDPDAPPSRLAESAYYWGTKITQQLHHSRWEGFTFYDLIMPLFLFVVGAAMPFSFSRRLELGHSKLRLYFKIVRRALILFIIGMAVQGNLLQFDLSKLHIFANTLQAIAVGYLIASFVMLLLPVWGQVAVAVLLMIGYWLLLMYVPVGDLGRGVLQEQANVALAVDQWVLGRFIDGTNPAYTWVLSGMTFTATVLLGVFAGYVLGSRSAPLMKFFWLALLGSVCLAAGWAWAEYLHFPIIKHLWTSSMVLWAAGLSYLLLAVFYLVIDVIGLRFLAFPLVVIGMNAILVYVVYHLGNPVGQFAKTLIGGVAHHLGEGEQVTIALATVLLEWLILYHLYRHKVFLRI